MLVTEDQFSDGQRQKGLELLSDDDGDEPVFQDDPLSALDHQVAQQVFEDGIKRLVVKQKRTVILVTQNIQLISHAHQVICDHSSQCNEKFKIRKRIHTFGSHLV